MLLVFTLTRIREIVMPITQEHLYIRLITLLFLTIICLVFIIKYKKKLKLYSERYQPIIDVDEAIAASKKELDSIESKIQQQQEKYDSDGEKLSQNIRKKQKS